jgi:hypothetical protein
MLIRFSLFLPKDLAAFVFAGYIYIYIARKINKNKNKNI